MSLKTTQSPRRPLPKADRDEPESMAQARRWEVLKNRYLALNVCHTCASQLAWGHQLGFTRLQSAPCNRCLPVLATFPLRAANGWHNLPRALAQPSPQASEPRHERHPSLSGTVLMRGSVWTRSVISQEVPR